MRCDATVGELERCADHIVEVFASLFASTTCEDVPGGPLVGSMGAMVEIACPQLAADCPALMPGTVSVP